jgi:NhaP-type Na+/H+ and K+/H+ antiporter
MKKRISINSTRYGGCHCGHAWITLNKNIIANFCTRAFWNTRPVSDEKTGKWVQGEEINEKNKKYDNLENTYGELSRQDVYESCWAYVHDLSIEQAVLSDNPLIQSLAMIDKRLGKRKIKEIDINLLHPLAKRLLKERIEIEKISDRAENDACT